MVSTHMEGRHKISHADSASKVRRQGVGWHELEGVHVDRSLPKAKANVAASTAEPGPNTTTIIIPRCLRTQMWGLVDDEAMIPKNENVTKEASRQESIALTPRQTRTHKHEGLYTWCGGGGGG